MFRLMNNALCNWIVKKAVWLRIPQKYIVCMLMAINIMHWKTLTMTFTTSFEYLVTYIDANATTNQRITVFETNTTRVKLCTEKEIPRRGPYSNIKMTIGKWSLTNDLYFYTDTLIHVPIGLACDKYGVRNLVIASSILGTLLASMYPTTVSETSSILFILHRMLQAIIETIVTLSSIHIISHWAGKEESTVLISVTYMGFTLGTMYSELLMASLLTINWTVMFYILASTYFVLLLLNLYFLYNDPIQSPFTTQEEKQKTLAEFGEEYPEYIPWKKIVKDGSVWAILAGQHATLLISYFNTMYIHFFLASVIGIDIFDYYYTVVFMRVGSILMPISWSLLAQYCINKKMMPVLYVRTFSAVIGNIIPFIFIILSTYTGCLPQSILICHALGAAFKELAWVGVKGNIIDITRYYCSLIDGIVHGWGKSIVGLTMPKLLVVFRMNSVNDFRMVICSIGSISTFLTILYYVWANGVRAHWDTVETEEDILEVRLQRSKKGGGRKTTVQRVFTFLK